MRKQAFTAAFISVLLITLLLVASVPSLGAVSEAPQPQWSRTYGAWQAFSVVQTGDGGYAVAGAKATQTFRGYTNVTTLLVKTDSSGELQWEKTYGSEFGAGGGANSVVQTDDLGYALCGSGWLLKTDSQGKVEWNKTFGPPEACRAIQASNRGYVIVGFELISESDQQVPVLLKTDENGNLLLNKTLSPSSFIARAYNVVETNDGGFTVAGSLDNNVWLAKFAPESAVPESPYSMVWIIVTTAVIVTAVISAGLLVYFKKRKQSRAQRFLSEA